MRFLHALRAAATWPRRKLAAAGYEHEYRKAQLRQLAAELAAAAPPPAVFTGSMCLDHDPRPHPPAEDATWLPHARWADHERQERPTPELLDDLPPVDVLEDSDDQWVSDLANYVQHGPWAAPTRIATTADFDEAYASPHFARVMGAEQAALERTLDRMTAEWHHQQNTRRPA